VQYQSNTTGATYRLNIAAMDAAEAEAVCLSYGGHLVSYSSLVEQVEVSSAAPAARVQSAPASARTAKQIKCQCIHPGIA
jgi:hypothetical protein